MFIYFLGNWHLCKTINKRSSSRNADSISHGNQVRIYCEVKRMSVMLLNIIQQLIPLAENNLKSSWKTEIELNSSLQSLNTSEVVENSLVSYFERNMKDLAFTFCHPNCG